MSNNTPRAVESKHKRDEALAVADFKIDDVLNVPGDQLLAEVAEDFGDPAFLAAQFDSIALPAVSTRDMSRVNRRRAIATLRVQPGAPGAALVRAFPRSPRWSLFRATLALLAERPVVLLRRRIFLGTLATLLLMAALAPGTYPLLVNRSADHFTAVSRDKPLTQLPTPMSSVPLPTKNPAPGGLGVQSLMPPEAAHILPQPSPAEQKPVRTVTEENNRVAGLLAGRQVSPLPDASVASREQAPRIAAAPPAIAGALPAARPRVTAGDGFFVELSSPKSEAEALSALRALKSEYAVLKGYELEIRRKDEGERGVIYSVQVGPFESQDDAKQLCEQLKTAGGICFVSRK
jgi:cell division septation protein DedD